MRRPPLRSRLLRTAFCALGLVALAAPLVIACGADKRSAEPIPDEPTPTPNEGGTSECPADPPAADGPCTQPDGTSCAYGACSDFLVSCTDGRWRASTVSTPAQLCPREQPRAGAPCSPCFPTTLACAFGCDDGESSGWIAHCTLNRFGDLRWQVESRTCPTTDLPDAGEPDAGEPDAGEPDAGEPDAGEPDAGEPDAG